MAKIFTTPAAESAAKTFLHDITLAAGIRTNNQRSNGLPKFNPQFKSSAKLVCDEVINRDFTDIDSSILYLARYSYNISMTGAKYKSFNAEFVAKSLVYLAEMANAYWDDTIRTPYEIEEFNKTILGKTVLKYGRYISAIKGKSAKATSGTSGSRAAGQLPKNDYKQSGPQSGNVRDLLGQPGDKVLADGSVVYKIIGYNPASKNVPNAFINPISSSGASGSTNKVKIGSGNGYTDCTCFFDDPNDAQDFLDKIIASGKIPVNVSNLRIVKVKADANGYFLVGTEFGQCAISARKLNEDLAEECANVDDRPVNWEKATESYSEEEKRELHTWMRRG